MGTRKRNRKELPSIKGLIKLSRELGAVARSLKEASRRPLDPIGRRRIEETRAEVGRRVQRLRTAVDTINKLKAKRASYEQRIQKTDRRIDTLLGRQFRGNQAWLRRWARV